MHGENLIKVRPAISHDDLILLQMHIIQTSRQVLSMHKGLVKNKFSTMVEVRDDRPQVVAYSESRAAEQRIQGFPWLIKLMRWLGKEKKQNQAYRLAVIVKAKKLSI